MFGFKSKKRKAQEENMRIISRRRAEKRDRVRNAVIELNHTAHRAVNGREIASYLRWDSASVTNRLSELVKRGQLHVHEQRRGLDGIWRKYYGK